MLRIVRLLIAWGAVALFHYIHLNPGPTTSPWLVVAAFIGLLSAIAFASFGVLEEANALARRLGEPYGSLILTISVLIIEVVLIAAVMMGPAPAPTIGRDSIYSVMMIILNLVIGAAILVGFRRHGPQTFNRRGAQIYLALIGVFGGVAFLVPHLFVPYTGGFPVPWTIGLAVAVAGIYLTFLFLQMGRWRGLFRDQNGSGDHTQGDGPDRRASVETRSVNGESRAASIPVRSGILVTLLVAISLLAEHLAVVIDFGVAEAGLPVALGGVVIAAIVFTPETLTTVKAAANNQMQRVVNLCLGAFVSTIGMTFPSVLLLGMLAGKEVVFGLGGQEAGLFVATVALTTVTFTRSRTAWPYGIAHLALFAVFAAMIFTG